MPQSTELKDVLEAGALLIHSERLSSTPAANIEDVLSSRISQYRSRLGLPEREDAVRSLEDIHLETAQEALSVVERVQQILDADARLDTQAPSTSTHRRYREDTPGEVPVIGTRDISQLRTLLSIAFQWGLEPVLERVQSAWPSKPSARAHRGPRIVNLSNTQEDHARLALMTKRLLGLLFPRGVHGELPQTLITSTLLGRHVTGILRLGIALGWVPKSLASAGTPVIDELRPLIMRLLSILPPSQTIASLGTILSSPTSLAPHVQKACASLLSRQLLRPDGVRGLCAAVFGEGESAEDDAPLEKLEHIARVLSAVPSTVKPEEYYETIIPRVLTLMSSEPNIPPAYKRAAAFSLSRMVLTDVASTNSVIASRVLLPILHGPFLKLTPDLVSEPNSPATTPISCLQLIQTFLTNTDPSPTLISMLISPIVPSLYSLLSTLERTKTADPALREAVRGLLVTWGRTIEAQEGVAILWACVEDQGGHWSVDIAGELKKVERLEEVSPIALFTPEDLRRAEENGELDPDANLLDLRPDPAHFVRYVKSLDRVDLSSEFFVRLLEAYREIKAERDGDPMRTLLYLQLILQIQTRMLSEGYASGNTFSKPEHILSFVKHALDAGTAAPRQPSDSRPAKKIGLTMDDLRIVDEDEEDDFEDGGDSDDETPGLEGVPPDEEMTATAMNLLLSILEANPDLSASTAPILADILVHIEELSKHPSEVLRPLAREARMVLTVRLASSSTAPPSKQRSTSDESAQNTQETYQKALKLLQDPILPVRAHGLLLLRQLVAPPRTASIRHKPSADILPLVPAILDIFLQSVQDDDSYVFLNAVQGLAVLVDSFGSEVLRSLVRVYTEGLQATSASAGMLTQAEVDTRLRVGEALGQVVRKCGDALPIYADALIPPLFAAVRASHLPTVLRASSLSLLAQCAETCDLALMPYGADLAEAMLDLLQLESVQAAPNTPAPTRARDTDTETQGSAMNNPRPVPNESLDSRPSSRNSKHPPLRRAALHFLALLARAYTIHILDDDVLSFRSEFPVSRAKGTLGYVAVTDVDGVARVMAREVGEAVVDLERAIAGGGRSPADHF